MKKKLLILSSYIFVSALSTVLTLGLVFWKTGGISKLDQLESLITDFYIGEVNQTELEDAAAAAMISAIPALSSAPRRVVPSVTIRCLPRWFFRPG